ncbi:Protein NRT1/ PTR FAMILY 4.5 [Linum grandiflorum]
MKPPTCNVFDPTADCKKLKGGDAAYLYTALYLLAAGSAGLKASLPAHGADQFDEKDPQEARQRSGFFNYLLLAVCSGGAISITFIVWIQDKKGWDWGFAIGCLALGVGLLVFFAGFLDRAAIQTTTETAAVENAKIFLGMLPIFYCTIIMTLCLAQLQTFSIEQGLTMDSSMTKSFKIPPASLPIIPIAFLIILIPVYDQLCVPLIRRFTGHPNGITHLQRIGVGLILSCVSMAAASIMEVKRKAVARDHGMLDALPVFWLSIQFFIFGVADMFTYIGLLEFFYSEAPRALKSMSTCFLWSSMALGYFLSTIMVKIVNRATADKTRSGGWLAGNNINRNHLNLFYLLLAVMSFVNFCVYLVVARRYVYRPKSSPADVTDSLAVHSGEKKSTAKDQV